MNFTMQRDRVVTTAKGHSVEFKKGVATHVPPEVYEEVMAQGAVPSEDIPEAQLPKVMTPESTAERKKKIMDAMLDIVTANAVGDFTAGGTPHAKVLSTKVGFLVDAGERDVLWAELNKTGN